MDFVFDPSLALYLPLYELDGSSFVSKDAYGHLCVVTGALWAPWGGWFDGTDDNIDCGTPSALNITQALTVEAWVNAELLAGDNRQIAGKGNTNAYSGFSWLFRCQGLGDNTLYFEASSGTGSVFSLTSLTALVLSRWYHICVTYNQGVRAAISVNGVEEASTTSFSGTIQNNDTLTQKIGCRKIATGIDDWWKGLIGEVRIYNRALTLLEIQHNYLATKWRYQ